MIFKTKRLIIRPSQADDADDLYRYASDKDAGISAVWSLHDRTGHALVLTRKSWKSRKATGDIIL